MKRRRRRRRWWWSRAMQKCKLMICLVQRRATSKVARLELPELE